MFSGGIDRDNWQIWVNQTDHIVFDKWLWLDQTKQRKRKSSTAAVINTSRSYFNIGGNVFFYITMKI